ncbi:MAG TPA: insulinase family protein [Polyangiaceae bacterium]|nr:insulinase family protein [Polyangiaceae bacterium]
MLRRTRTTLLLVAGLAAVGCPAPPAADSTTPPPPIGTTEPEAPRPDRGKLPTPAEAADWSLPTVATWKMGNGMEIWHLEQRSTPLVSLRMVFPRGSASDPPGKAGLTGLTADMLDEGAGDRSALEIGEALQRLATDYSASPDVDGVMATMDMLADEVGPSLSILSDILRKPRLSAEELQRRQSLWIAQAISRESNPGAVQALIERRVLYGDGYSGWSSYGTKTSLKGIRLGDVKRQYAAVFQPEGVKVVVVGAIDAPTLKKHLEASFGDWKGKPTAKPAEVVEAPLPTKAVYLADFPGSTQSAVSVVRRADGVDASDYFSSRVFNWALGGAFSSRLNLNLREDKGYTYGARSGFERHLKAGMFGLSSKVKSETTRPSIDEMLAEIERIGGAQPLSETEHTEAIDGLMLGFPGRFERLSSTAGQLAYQAQVGRDANWLGAWPDKLRNVTLEQARQSAKAYADLDDYVIVVAGDAKKLESTLDGLGPIYRCDAEGRCKK